MTSRAMRRAGERRAEKEARRRIQKTTGLALSAGAAVGATVLFAQPAEAATFTVTNNNDSGAGSLRDAIDQANLLAGADTITFAPNVTGTIALTTGQLPITESVTIVGPGAAKLTVNGGGIDRVFYADGSGTDSIVISGLTVTGGNTTSEGGGLYANDTDLTLTDMVFTGNTANKGGAVATDSMLNMTLTRVTITNNTSTDDGGGIYIDDAASFVMTSSVVSGNVAADDGGGILLYNLYGSTPIADRAVIKDSLISGNTAGDNGGGISNYTDTVNWSTRVVNTTITGNSAGANGGAVWLYDANNPADPANGTTFTHSTISGNTAPGVGGVYGQDSVKTFQSTIVANNGIDLGLSAVTDSGFLLDFSLIENPGVATVSSVTAGSNLTGVDPQLGTLADNGGGIKTLAPAYTSPVVDHGRTYGVTPDARGVTRPADLVLAANVAGGDGADIGAVELPKLFCSGKEVTIVAKPGVPTAGTSGDDVILGTAGADLIKASGGDDLVCGGGGNDKISGGGGNDKLFGEDGNDKVAGGGGKDKVSGGNGNDKLKGNGGNDKLKGDAGNDKLKGGGGNDKLKGGAGKDKLKGGAGDDKLRGGSGKDKVDGGPGNDSVKGRLQVIS